MAAPAIAVERFRVEHGEGFTMPVVSLTDRRAAGNRLVRFVFQRHLETVLYGRSEGSSGPIWKAMNAAGIGATTMTINKAAVTAGTITEAEFEAIMDVFKSALPADVVDPCSLGRIRNCTILPLAAAATVVRTFGRSPASMAWLRALSQPVPQAWELREEREANDAAGEVDLVLNEKLDDGNFEADESSFADELMTMPAFSADRDDEERLKTYILQRVPPMLKKELDTYLLYRTETFAARRAGGAVQSISAEADQTALLRFFGWMAATNRPVVGHSITFLIRDDLGDIAQEYAQWLQTTQRCKFSTIANYINGLVSITSYCYANLAPSDALLAMDPSPLTQLINLRGQAEKASKTQQMFHKRVGGWMEWSDVQKARVASMKKLEDMGDGGAPAAKRNLLRDCCALSLLSLIPPDRVGCIRKLRLGHTLKQKESGEWMIDLSKQRDGHKTSRFYGPFAASLPSALTPILNKYTQLFSLEVGGEDAYLFHPPQSGFDRAMESSAWSQWVGRCFQRHAGVAIAPKTLRSIFITWLRSNTDAPEILKSAAHAQKHSEARQASDDYDQQADDRLVKAAYDYNISFAMHFSTASISSGNSSGEGSSSAAHVVPVQPVQPVPPPPAQPQQPAPPPTPPHGSVMSPPIPQAEFNSQLADVGFTKKKAKGDGDCFPLSAMAGFEISATAARQPRAGTIAQVRGLREGAVGILTGDAAVDGIDAVVFRAGEKLPEDDAAARAAMAPWLQTGFWNTTNGNKFASFMLGVSLHLERPVAVIERKGKTYLNPVRVYGARDANGALLHSVAKPNAPETVPTFKLVPFADLIETLRINPTACSVVEFNGSNHFDPWLLKPSLRAAALVAADGVAADAGLLSEAQISDQLASLHCVWADPSQRSELLGTAQTDVEAVGRLLHEQLKVDECVLKMPERDFFFVVRDATQELSTYDIAERLAALECQWVDPMQPNELRGTSFTNTTHVAQVLAEAGIGECVLHVPGRDHVYKRSVHKGCCLDISTLSTAEGDGAALLADEEWATLQGGPWLARLMRPSRQPTSAVSWRNYALSMDFDPANTPLVPGGAIKLPIVPGAPSEGLVLRLPQTWTPRQRTIVFRLKLSKTGATQPQVTINQVLYRRSAPCDSDAEASAGADEADEPDVGVNAPPPAPPARGSSNSAAWARSVLGNASAELGVDGEAEEEAMDDAAIAETAAVGAHPDFPDFSDLEDEVVDGDATPPMLPADPPPPPAPPAQPPTPRPQRERKRKERFGDNGELDGAASNFRSAPAFLAQEPPLGDAEAGAEAVAWDPNALAWLQPGCCGEPGSVLLFLDVDGVLNKGIATYANPAALTIRGWPHALDIELLRRLKSVLTQSGASIVLSSTWRDNDLGKRLLARGFAAVGIPCDVVVGATPLQGASRIDEIKAWLARCAPACERWVAVDDMNLLADAPDLSAHVVRTSTDAGLTSDVAEECVAKLAAPPPPPAALPPPVALPPASRPQRERKRKAQYGDNGELDGNASSFRSAPAARKASVDPSMEMGVPAYALPGEEVWAMGLHAGARKRFKAEVLSLRKQFPRIIVKYTATEDGNTAAIALPEMRTAYVTMADVEPKDW